MEAETIAVSPAWLIGAALAIISAVAGGVLWLANRFSRVETCVAVLTKTVEGTTQELANVKADHKDHEGRIRLTELELAKLQLQTAALTTDKE